MQSFKRSPLTARGLCNLVVDFHAKLTVYSLADREFWFNQWHRVRETLVNDVLAGRAAGARQVRRVRVLNDADPLGVLLDADQPVYLARLKSTLPV